MQRPRVPRTAAYSAISIAVCALCVACAPGRGGHRQDGDPTSNVDVVSVELDPRAAAAGPATMTSWLVYAAAKRSLIDTRVAAGGRTDDFSIEASAREALVDHWRSQQATASTSEPYLDRLVEVADAGYLDEYVIAAFGEPGWTIPPDVVGSLDLPGFFGWGQERLRDHTVETWARIELPGDVANRGGPGESVDVIDAFQGWGGQCSEVPADARDALDDWDDAAASLVGVPLAAQSWVDLGRVIAPRRESADVRDRGVSWVPFQPAALSFALGFCELEAGRPETAVSALRRAVALYPSTPVWRGELALALIATDRFDAADREIESAQEMTDDPCELARVWRTRGLLEIERGRLDEAALAYSVSLEYEPGNALATDQLEVIEASRADASGGGNAPMAPLEVSGPEVSGPIVSRCGS